MARPVTNPRQRYNEDTGEYEDVEALRKKEEEQATWQRLVGKKDFESLTRDQSIAAVKWFAEKHTSVLVLEQKLVDAERALARLRSDITSSETQRDKLVSQISGYRKLVDDTVAIVAGVRLLKEG